MCTTERKKIRLPFFMLHRFKHTIKWYSGEMQGELFDDVALIIRVFCNNIYQVYGGSFAATFF